MHCGLRRPWELTQSGLARSTLRSEKTPHPENDLDYETRIVIMRSRGCESTWYPIDLPLQGREETQRYRTERFNERLKSSDYSGRFTFLAVSFLMVIIATIEVVIFSTSLLSEGNEGPGRVLSSRGGWGYRLMAHIAAREHFRGPEHATLFPNVFLVTK